MKIESLFRDSRFVSGTVPSSSVTPATNRNDTASALQAHFALKWPAHLVLVRHAQSERNVWKEVATSRGDFVYGGNVRDIDVPLTPIGEKQAIVTGHKLAQKFRFDQVFVSPFTRTMQTARLITAEFPFCLSLVEDDRLREIDFGVLDGLTKHGIAHFQPAEKERRARLGKYHHRPPGGENYPDVALRLHSFLGTLAREAVGESVLVVSHSVVVLVFRKLLERLSEQQLLAIESDKSQEVANCSVTYYACDPGAGKQGKLILQDFNRIYY
jgi:broad specificity phosphatase PhoE